MTEQIREQVRNAMQAKGISQEKIAEQIGMEQPSISRMLRPGGVGKLPASWEALLDALDLELKVVPKGQGG